METLHPYSVQEQYSAWSKNVHFKSVIYI